MKTFSKIQDIEQTYKIIISQFKFQKLMELMEVFSTNKKIIPTFITLDRFTEERGVGRHSRKEIREKTIFNFARMRVNLSRVSRVIYR